jgi:hypothetical protein
MSNRLALWMLAACTLSSSGCMLIVQGARNVCSEFCDSLDECTEARECRRWAKECWERISRCKRGVVYSKDYACGFEDGFVAYVWRGGSGEPPPVPPPKYRKARYRTLEGCRAIEQWFAGYRYGANIARENGYRRLVTGPSSLPPLPPPGADGLPPPAVAVPQPVPAPGPPPEDLPLPRTVPENSEGDKQPASAPELGPAAAGDLAPVPFEVQPAPDGGAEADATAAPRHLVPVPFEVQPATGGGADGDNSTDKPEG